MKTDLKDNFIKLVDEGSTISLACKKLGIHRSTFYEWQNEDPMFGYKVTMARHTSIERITDIAEQWIGKWVTEGERKSVYRWLDRNHPRFLKTGNRISLITRREREIEEEASVLPLEEDDMFIHLRAMRNSGFAFMINMPPHIKTKYEAWLDKNDPQRGDPEYKKRSEEREKQLDAEFNPIKAQELINIANKLDDSIKRKNPWQGNP